MIISALTLSASINLILRRLRAAISTCRRQETRHDYMRAQASVREFFTRVAYDITRPSFLVACLIATH